MKKTHYLKWLWLIACAVFTMQARAQVWTTLYETNFQTWISETSSSRVCVDMGNGQTAWKRNISVNAAATVPTSVTNNSDLVAADLTGGFSRSGGTNYLQLPEMEFNNSARITIYAYKNSTSTGRNWTVYANQLGVPADCANSGSNDMSQAGTQLLATGELPGRSIDKYTATVSLNGNYNINFFGAGGDNWIIYIKIETEQKEPTVDLTDGSRNAIEMEGVMITPVTYTYAVATAAQVDIQFYPDANYTPGTEIAMPSGLTWTDTGNNTFTLGGTPDIGVAGTYYYRVSVPSLAAPVGDTEDASIEIVTCEATIKLTSDPATENQARKAGFAIDPIVYAFSNIDGVPKVNGNDTYPYNFDGLTAEYDAVAKTLTITGSPAVKATHAEYPYTINIAVSAQKTATCTGPNDVNKSAVVTARDPDPQTLFIPHCP